jgi:hypothetical protein
MPALIGKCLGVLQVLIAKRAAEPGKFGAGQSEVRMRSTCQCLVGKGADCRDRSSAGPLDQIWLMLEASARAGLRREAVYAVSVRCHLCFGGRKFVRRNVVKAPGDHYDGGMRLGREFQ